MDYRVDWVKSWKIERPRIFVFGLTKSRFTRKGPVLKYLSVGWTPVSSCSPVPAYVPGPDGSLIAAACAWLINEDSIFGLDACIDDSPSVADLVLWALKDVRCLLSKANFFCCGLFGPVNCPK